VWANCFDDSDCFTAEFRFVVLFEEIDWRQRSNLQVRATFLDDIDFFDVIDLLVQATASYESHATVL
jgi:hypothetical protein